MDQKHLVTIGLTHLQAEAYTFLLEQGRAKPPELAQKLQTTRTNAYKLLDKLVELRLATRLDEGKKFTYRPTSPLALTNLTAAYRAEAVAKEEAVSSILQELLAKYHEHSDKPGVIVASGKRQVMEAYKKQLSLREDIYFIHTNADIPHMGFDTMHNLRVTPGRHGKQRHGIMAAPASGRVNYAQHKRSNLEITWRDNSDYNAPVEWSVTDSSLLIVLYASEPQAILIIDTLVATAFKQLWHTLDTYLQTKETHQKLARQDRA